MQWVLGDLRCDLLLGVVKVGGRVALVVALANAVDLVVDRGTMVVAHLTSTSDGPLDVGRMPGADAGLLMLVE